MRRQYRSFVVTMVVVSLCCGFIGCRSNGGPWYKTSSYKWHNPFKTGSDFGDENEYERFAGEDNGIRMPREGQNPDLDLSTPAGGYSGGQLAKNTNTGTPSHVQATTGGYGTPHQPQYQNTPVAMSQPHPPYQSQSVNYSGVPQGQAVVQGQYPHQYPQSQYPQDQYPQSNGTVQAPNPQYQTQYPPSSPSNTNNNGHYSPPSGQQPQYDPSYGTTQVPNGYTTGQNFYHNEEYNPGGSRF